MKKRERRNSALKGILIRSNAISSISIVEYWKKALIVVVMSLMLIDVSAQKSSVAISGVVMDADSVRAIPYVNILLKNSFFGTVSDNSGHFSFTASEGDTLQFSCIGYFDAYFIMPENLNGDSYSLIQLLRKETIMLEEVVIFPWPEYEQFKNAFLTTQPKRNLGDVAYESKRKIKRISVEEYERNKYYYNMYYNNQLYDLTGIVPFNNFLNPMEWTNFIRNVTAKKYKKEKK
ncbi:MAG: carboxypeptidase-like regulatory domain-containing protein [Cyclobacteriaceae bacterium]|nr:carboxypeptidase-like regulatory domain-containing protein [Cyclobacteriaceae bacterium]